MYLRVLVGFQQLFEGVENNECTREYVVNAFVEKCVKMCYNSFFMSPITTNNVCVFNSINSIKPVFRNTKGVQGTRVSLMQVVEEK